MEQWIALLRVIAWPIIVLLGIFLFRKVLRDVLSREDLSFSGPGGFSFSARRAAGALDKAAEARGAPERPSEADAEDLVKEVTDFVRQRHRNPRILWVDDHPSNSRYERSAIDSMGMLVDLSTSTNDAQQKMQRRGEYDVIISDMARGEEPNVDREAGYELLKWLRDRGDETAYIIYRASNDPEHFDEAIRRGAFGSTGSPQELVEMVLRSLRNAKPRTKWWQLR